MSNSNYSPEQYWDQKARRNADDPLKAVSVGDLLRDRCIDRIQQRLMRMAFARLERDMTLPGAAILDFGCGTGRWTGFLQEHGLRYSGCDISSEMLRQAGKRFPDADFRKIDNLTIPYPDQQFDIVMSIAVIHHNNYPEQDVLLREILRVLKPGGRVLLFEGLGQLSTTGNSVHFYRNGNGWRKFLRQKNLLPVWTQSTRYWTLQVFYENVAEKIFGKRLKQPGIINSAFKLKSRVLTWLDIYVDPLIISLLPEKMQSRIFLILEHKPD